MPVEAILPLAVFGSMLVIWIVLPPQRGDNDLGNRVRDFLLRRRWHS